MSTRTYFSQETQTRVDRMAGVAKAQAATRKTTAHFGKIARTSTARKGRVGVDVRTGKPGKSDYVRKKKHVGRIKKKVTGLEHKISRKIPTLTEISAAGGRFREKRPEIATSIHRTMGQLAGATRRVLPEKTGRAIGESSVEFYQYAQEKPLHLVKDVGMAYGGGYLIGGAAKGGSLALRYGAKRAATKVGGRVGKIITGGVKYGEPSMGVVGVGAMGIDVATSSSQKEAIKKIAHIGIGTAGAVKGFKDVGKAHEMWRVRGLKELPVEQAIKPEVISGKEQFPSVPEGMKGKEFMEYFKTSKYKLPGETPGTTKVWHATPQKFSKKTELQSAVTRGDDVPGLYVAPSISPHFMRVGGVKAPTTPTKVPLMKRLFGESEPLEPAVLRIDVPGGITRLPKDIRTQVSPAREFLETGATPGKGYLTPVVEKSIMHGAVKGKVEAEAVLAPKTVLSATRSRYFIKVGEHRVPITEYAAELGKAPVKITKGKTKKTTAGKVKDKIEYYRPTSREPLVRPYVRPYRKPSKSYHEISTSTSSSTSKPSKTRRATEYITPRRVEYDPSSYVTPSRRGDRLSTTRRGIDYVTPRRGGYDPSSYVTSTSRASKLSTTGRGTVTYTPDMFKPPVIGRVKIDPETKRLRKKKKSKKGTKRYDIESPVPDMSDIFGVVKQP